MFHDLFLFSFLRETEEKPGWCSDPHRPPCAGYEFFLLLFFLLLKFIMHILIGHRYFRLFFLQICWDYGSGLLSRCMEVCVAFDSGKQFLLCITNIIIFSVFGVRVDYPRKLSTSAFSTSYYGKFLQNDLVHGWGLDFALQKCVEVRLMNINSWSFFFF